jgi:hypothetical protein
LLGGNYGAAAATQVMERLAYSAFPSTRLRPRTADLCEHNPTRPAQARVKKVTVDSSDVDSGPAPLACVRTGPHFVSSHNHISSG